MASCPQDTHIHDTPGISGPVTDPYSISYSVLGPVFRMFCLRLRLVEQFKAGAPLLFLSRGGIRLHHFYRLYLSTNSLVPISPATDFYISRMAAFRALLAGGSQYAAREICKEYRAYSLRDAMECFLPAEVYAGWLELFDQEHSPESPVRLEAAWLLDYLAEEQPSALHLSSHLKQQKALLTSHFSEATAGGKDVIPVDTGWSGSIVHSMRQLFPDSTFTACFFGRYNYGKAHPPWFDSISGLIMQHDRYQWLLPQSSFVFHRHVIEHVCEPHWPSVEYYVLDGSTVYPGSGNIPEHICRPGDDEPLARGVADYIAQNPVAGIHSAMKEYNHAMRRLARLLCFPGRETALALGGISRSADFGRDLDVPVLIAAGPLSGKLKRLAGALWQNGQAALEFRVLRLPVQLAIVVGNSMAGIRGRLRSTLRRIRGG